MKGARKVRSRILKLMWYLTGSQWSCRRTGTICSKEGVLQIIWSSWSLWGHERETKRDRIAKVNTGCNHGVNENGGAVRCKWQAEIINIAKMEVCRTSNTVNVCFKRQWAVQDDTRTLNLRGGKNCGIFKSQIQFIRFSQSRFSTYEEDLSFIIVRFENQDLISSQQSGREVDERQ